MTNDQPGTTNPFEPTTPNVTIDPLSSLAGPAPVAPKSGAPIGKILGISAGVLLLAGGGAFAYTQLVKPKSNTPVQAVESFYTALAKADAIGLAETLDPGERDILLDSMVPMVAEMNRLEFFKDADLKQIKGVSGSFTNYKATSKNLRDDLAEVTVAQGTLVTNFDPKALPLGKNLNDAFKDVIESSEKTSTTTQLKDTPFVVHKTGGKWYVSLNYSVAEASRRDAVGNGETLVTPLKAAGVQAKGADTPELAVSAMMQAMADVNVERMIELVPPDELPALQNYSDMFLPDAKQALAIVDDGYKLTVTPKLRSTTVAKDRAMVFIDDLPFKLAVDNDQLKLNVTYADSKIDATAKTPAGDAIDAKYARGDFNVRVALSDGTKATAQRVKNDVRATFDGSDGSQGRVNYTKGALNASLNLSDGTNGTATYRNGDFNASVTASDGTTGTANVKGDKIDAALSFPDGSQTTLKFADECLVISSGLDEQKACGKQEIIDTFFGPAGAQFNDPRVLGQLGLDRFFPSDKGTAEQQKTCARKLPKAKIGFTTVQRNGKWFVSPMRTMLDAMTAQMRVYEPKDIDCLRTQFKSIADQVREQVEQTINARTQVASTLSEVDTLPSEDPFATDPFASDTAPSSSDSLPDASEVDAMTEAELDAFLKSFDTIVPDTTP